MKKIISAALCLLLVMLPLVCCGRTDPGSETETYSIRDEYMERRRAFMESELYTEVMSYLAETFGSLIEGSVTEISLEPGDLKSFELSDYGDFRESKETRLRLFSEADVTARMNYWEFGDADPMMIGELLILGGISCKLMAGPAGGSYFDVDAVNDRCTLIPVAEPN